MFYHLEKPEKNGKKGKSGSYPCMVPLSHYPLINSSVHQHHRPFIPYSLHPLQSFPNFSITCNAMVRFQLKRVLGNPVPQPTCDLWSTCYGPPVLVNLFASKILPNTLPSQISRNDFPQTSSTFAPCFPSLDPH